MILELVKPRPDWIGALEVAIARPRGVPERRAHEDPWRPSVEGRPRRISDDLAWFRSAMDEPEEYGLRPVDEGVEGAWQPEEESDVAERLARLRDRGVLDAAGFLLHEDEVELVG
jgi:hypothetical protein